MWQSFLHTLDGLTWGRAFSSGAGWLALVLSTWALVRTRGLRKARQRLGPPELRGALEDAREDLRLMIQEARYRDWFATDEPRRSGQKLADVASRTQDRGLRLQMGAVANTLRKLADNAPEPSIFIGALMSGGTYRPEETAKDVERKQNLAWQQAEAKRVLPDVDRALARLDKHERRAID